MMRNQIEVMVNLVAVEINDKTMKILIMKLGMHYRPDPIIKHAALGEVDQIANMFNKSGHSTKIITDEYCNDPKCIPIGSKMLLDEFDTLVIINGLVRPDMDLFNEMQYDIIDEFDGKVLFCLCDIALPLRKYSIKRDDIICITQAKLIDEVEDFLDDEYEGVPESYVFETGNYHHFPFYKFPIMTNEIMESTFEYDLMYGGGFREGDRAVDMYEFYFDHLRFDSVMFGNIKESMFDTDKYDIAPEFHEPVHYDNFCEKMSTSMATVIISDPIYKVVGSLTQRIYESILAGCVTFIHDDVDPDHTIYGYHEPRFSDFLYVDDGNELSKKMAKIKNSDWLRRQVNDFARCRILGDKTIDLNRKEFIDSFDELINKILN